MKDSTKKKLRDLILFKPDLRTIIIMCLGTIYNVMGHYLALHFNLPFWLDNVGTMAISIAFGPLAGAILAIVSQPIYGIPLGIPLPYYLIGIMMAVVIGFLFPRKHREDILAIVTVGVLAAAVTSQISVPLNMIYNNGYPHNLWGDSLYKMLDQKVSSNLINTFLSTAFIDLPDRVLTVFIALFLVDIEETRIFKKQQRSVTRTMTMLLAVIMGFSFLGAYSRIAKADGYDFDSEFDTMTYGTDDGILTSEVNAVTQTKDGYIWVGTYSGLYKYDGIGFGPAGIDDRVRNVMSLFVDSKGRLWIGTNDSGAFCYDPDTKEVISYNTANGLTSNSIRAICEDKSGNIFLGTVMEVSKINPDGVIKTFSQWPEISYCLAFTSLDDGSVLGVTNGGTLFLIRDDMLVDTDTYASGNTYFRAVACSGSDILVATTGSEMFQYKVEGDKLTQKKLISIPNHSYFSNIRYSPLYGGYFYCGEVGFGFIDKETLQVTDMTEQDFNGTVSDVCVDDQGNVWFASSKHGLLKCSHTPFRNIFKKAGVSSGVVNAVYESDGLLYVGMDNGLEIIDLTTNSVVDTPWKRNLDGNRVRNIMKDSKGNLWISTYSTNGMVRVMPSGQVNMFNEQNGTLGGKIRSAIELSDGRMLLASNMGLTFMKDDEVVATIGESDGLQNQYILSMYEREDGSILAASDGDGIYIIKNDRVVGHIGAAEGLATSVVMRIVKGSTGYFYVTSNALYYDDGYSIRSLKNFPYTNNYDILISDDGICWITSSAGVFVVEEKSLVEDGNYACTLLNKNWGLNTTFTANSWNLCNNGNLYLCCTDGVRILSMEEYSNKNSNYQIHLDSIQAGETVIHEKDGKFVIPAFNGRITMSIAITNYTLTNPLIHYYLEGFDDDGTTCYQNEILPLEFTNLGYGNYKLHVQVLNETTGEIEREEVFSIRKEAMMYEKLYFRMYLSFVASMVFFYIIWLFFTINKRAIKIRGLQREMSTDPMTGLYNKSASERILTRICEESTGILMMIDLDSFKLVNDIYGHDMGDKILIRFAELIRSAVGEGNMGGRLGGDEFIGFIKNTIDEEDVEQVTKYLNREIVASAKEYMGADMNIPLGASVGAVRVPNEGKEFDKLFRYADKALYIVKQNGKHGYAFYQKSTENQELEAGNADKNNLAQIKKIIGERNEGKGAYLVNFEKLQVIYKYLCRNNRATGARNGFVRISLTGPDEVKVPDEARDAFEEVLISGLKKNDVVSRYSGNFYVIFNGGDPESYEGIVKRITAKWKENAVFAKYEVTTEIESVG